MIPVAETLERVLPLLPKIGVTRLANITGLERIGLPVVLAIRPNALSLSVDGGKGVTLDAARASAAMESFERHAAECMSLPEERRAYTQLPAKRTIPVARLPLAIPRLFRPDWPEAWIWAEDPWRGVSVAVPAVCVGLDRRPEPWTAFTRGSNGLAAGNTIEEATAQALHEVIERDAEACWEVSAAETGQRPPRIDPDTIRDEQAGRCVEMLRRADLIPVILHLTNDLSVPAFKVYLLDVTQGILSRGAGAHLDPRVALLRALTEAAQALTVRAAGSRDDMAPWSGRETPDVFATLRGLPMCPWPDLADESSGDAAEDTSTLVLRLDAAGLDQVAVCDLTESSAGVPVVRVIVPGLEGYRSEFATPGPRARRR